MTIGLYDTFANPQGCHITRGALYKQCKSLLYYLVFSKDSVSYKCVLWPFFHPVFFLPRDHRTDLDVVVGPLDGDGLPAIVAAVGVGRGAVVVAGAGGHGGGGRDSLRLPEQ